MTTLRALGYLCWACAGLGVAAFYDARSVAPGGVLPHTTAWVVASLVFASLCACAAVGIHVAELVSLRRKEPTGGTCE